MLPIHPGLRAAFLALVVAALSLVACEADTDSPSPTGQGGLDAGGVGGSSGASGATAAGGAGGGHEGGASGATMGGSAGGQPVGGAGNGGGGGDADASTPAGGPVTLENVTNARHTGGLTTASNQHVRDFFLIRSGHLGGLDATGCAQFSALSIKTVIDLRDAADAAATPDAACVTSSAAYYLADLPKILPPSATSYEQTLDAAEPKLGAIFGQLTTSASPAVIHCVIGRDRASMITALVLLSLGVPEAQVLQDFTTNQDATVTVEAAWLQPVLDRVKLAGGIEAYLQSWGVTAQQLTALRAMALQ